MLSHKKKKKRGNTLNVKKGKILNAEKLGNELKKDKKIG